MIPIIYLSIYLMLCQEQSKKALISLVEVLNWNNLFCLLSKEPYYNLKCFKAAQSHKDAHHDCFLYLSMKLMLCQEQSKKALEIFVEVSTQSNLVCHLLKELYYI